MRILSVDFGTSSLKMAVVGENMELLAAASAPYSYRVCNRDWVEIDADVLVAAFIRAAAELKDWTADVELLCFDTFSPSMMFMDKEGGALYPVITHLDRRSKEQTKQILETMGKDAFQRITGIQPFTGGASVTTALWMMQNNPKVFDRALYIGHLNTYIYKLLTGVWATDPVNASMTGMYETTAWSGWSKDICQSLGIPMKKLPPILPAGTVAGRLAGAMAAKLGLKEGIPVALGTNDTAVSHLAAGNTEAGELLNVAGSSDMITILSDKPVVNDKYYLRCAVTPGMWQVFAITASGLAVDWFRQQFYRDMDELTFFRRELPSAIARVESTPVRFAPYLAGDRQSLTPKQAAFDGLTLDSTRRDLLAAILRGIHQPIRETVDLAGAFLRLSPVMKVTGGMLSPEFAGLKARLFPEFEFQTKENCTVLGSAILGFETLKNR